MNASATHAIAATEIAIRVKRVRSHTRLYASMLICYEKMPYGDGAKRRRCCPLYGDVAARIEEFSHASVAKIGDVDEQAVDNIVVATRYEDSDATLQAT